MPAALTAITTLLIKGIAAIPGLGGAAVWLTANMGIANLGTTLVLSWLLRTDVDNPFAQSSTSPGKGSIQPWQYIYGTVRTAGINTFVHVSGENNQFLNLIHILAAHQVEEIGQLYYNHEPIEIDGSGDAVGRFVNNVHIDKKLGTPKQEAITDLIDITTPFRAGGGLGFNLLSVQNRGLKLDGAYQYGVSTSVMTNPTDITIGLSFKPRINRTTTLISIDNGWKIRWNDDVSVSFIDASGTEIKSTQLLDINGNPVVFGAFQQNQCFVFVGISGGSITIELRVNQILTTRTTSLSYNKGDANGKVYVGSNVGISEFFGGYISNVAIWDIDRNADFPVSIIDVTTDVGWPKIFGAMANYAYPGHSPSEPDYTDVLVAWTLEEASGDSIDNSVASGRNDLIIKGAWTSDHTLNSRAYVRQRLIWDRTLFDRGVPPAAYDTKGKLVPDFLNEQTVTSIANAADEFTISGGHGFDDDDVVELYTRTGVLPSGSEAFVEYYVDSTGANTFKLYDAPAADTTRSLIALSDDGTAPVIVIQRVWSANAARCVMDYLHDPHIGMHIGFEEFDETSLLAAIDVCDDDVALDLGGTEKRYEANGILSSSKLPRENIQSLLSSMAGTLVWVGGKWFLYAGSFRTPTLTFDEDDFVSDINIQSLVPRSENFNAIKGVFVYPNSNWEPTDFPPVTSATFEAEDQGERVYGDINLPFTTSFSAAQRLAKIVLFRQREPLTVRTKMKLSAFQAQPGTVVKINNSRLGFVDKEFELISGNLILDTENGIVYNVVLRETNIGVYSWTTEEEDIGFLNNTALPDVFQIVPPTITLTSGTAALFKRLDGSIHSRIKVAISGNDPYVTEGGTYEIQYKIFAVSDWENFGSIPGNSTEAFILDVEDGEAYDVRVRAKNSAGVVSDWVYPIEDDTYSQASGHIVIGKTELPNDVVNFRASNNRGFVTLLWGENTDIDLGGYVIRYHEQGTPVWGSGFLLTDTVRTNNFITSDIPAGDWTILIKARDTTGNLSVNAVSYDVSVMQTNVVISSVEEADGWDGTLVNFVRHVSGVLIPQGTALVSSYSGFIGQASGVDFTKFCPDAFATSTYTADVVTLNTAGNVLLNSVISSHVGPDETGEPIVQIQVNIDPDGTGFTGWFDFVPGSYIVKSVQFRVVFTNTEENRVVVTGMSTIVDEEPVSQTQQGVVVTSGTPGVTIIFAVELNTIPIVTPVVKGSTALIPAVDNVTTSQADIQLWNKNGVKEAGVVDVNINTSSEAS